MRLSHRARSTHLEGGPFDARLVHLRLERPRRLVEGLARGRFAGVELIAGGAHHFLEPWGTRPADLGLAYLSKTSTFRWSSGSRMNPWLAMLLRGGCE